MFPLAGCNWGYFAVVIAARGTGDGGIPVTRPRGQTDQGTNYQFGGTIPSSTPRPTRWGGHYHITQSKIALALGGWTGRGFMQGTQSRA